MLTKLIHGYISVGKEAILNVIKSQSLIIANFFPLYIFGYLERNHCIDKLLFIVGVGCKLAYITLDIGEEEFDWL